MPEHQGVCLRPGCESELRTGRLYCSRDCANKDRNRRGGIIEFSKKQTIPNNVTQAIKATLGEDGAAFLRNMEAVALEDAVYLPTRTQKRIVEGGREGYMGMPELGVVRDADQIDFGDIELMLQCGPVCKALALKKAGLRSVWRNERSWTVRHQDSEFAAMVKANLVHIIPTFIDNMLTNLEYGTFFGNLVWEYTTPAKLGVDFERLKIDGEKRVAALSKIAAAAPETINRILYTSSGSFNGYEQYTPSLMVKPNVVPRYAALVVPYNGKFRNLWGESWMEPIWALWYWYEVCLRSFMRYLQRSGTPPVLGRAPSRALVKKQDGTEVEALDVVLEIAADVAKSNSAALPSEKWENGDYMWSLEYMKDDKRGDQFIDAIMVLADLIMGAGLTGDKGYSSKGKGGTSGESYASAEVHERSTSLDNERILDEQIAYLNAHLMPHFARYNLGGDEPQPWIVTAGLDRAELDRLFDLIKIAGNQESSEAMMRIDWKQVLVDNYIPVLTDDEYEERKKEMEEMKQKQFDQQKELAQSKGKPEDAGGDKLGGKPKPNEERPARGASKAK